MSSPIPSRPVRLLPDEVANQIAAGEVVERPASVLKELMENSLDAGAGRVQVEVRAGGRQFIRVLDDGHGLSPLLMALERHATSKLTSSQDLTRVGTLGFRGEALPSVAAVSRLTLRSRTAGAESGSEVLVEAGSIRQVREVGCPVGTLVEVRDLFHNLPARRKFLKSPATESAHLAMAFLRLACSRPGVAMRYQAGGQTLYDLPATEDLAVRAAALLGREAVGQMVPIEEVSGPLRLGGLAGLPSLSRPCLDQVYTFVNGRHVRDRLLLHAVGQAFQGLMPEGRRPVLVLMIELDPGEVDVNVHPAKVEVRFAQAGLVHEALARGLRQALARGREAARPASTPAPDTVPDWINGDQEAPAPAAPGLGPRPDLPPERPELPSQPPGRVAAPWAGQAPAYTPPPAPAPDSPAPTPEPPARPLPLFGPAGELTVIGQLHGLYILCSSPQGLVIVDQHAAHERLTYQDLRQALARGALPRQGLLAPATLELTPQETAWAERQAADWLRLGLEINPFGGRTWSVSALPAHLAGLDPAPLVRGLLAELAAAGVPPQTPEFMEVGLRSLACRGSIKQGQRLSPAEMSDLVARLAALPPPLTCPHGRPVLLTLTRRDLARHFKRTPEALT
ncbi:MAG: DNA mismatch repair endonuclease MutL [Desulfarculus sp.]|nr:DNA mismatch repair endonuclease MutL [Desulfarculus sp.]